MSRPKFATGTGDKNHRMVYDFLHDVCGGFEDHQISGRKVYFANFCGYRAWAIDTSGLGGLFLDWIVGVEDAQTWVEIKTPEAHAKPDMGLKPGERWTIDNLPLRKTIISTDEQVAELFQSLLELSLVGWAE